MDLSLLLPTVTLSQVKGTIAGFAELGNLLIDSWLAGDPSEQLHEVFAQTMEVFAGLTAKGIRGFYLDFATDPGDVDPYNPDNASLTPEPGFLSALGEQCFFTVRPGETYATTTVTFHNSSAFATTPFSPGQFTLAKAGSPEITFRNAADPAVYIGAGGTYSIPAGATVDLVFTAESPGTASNCDVDQLVTVTQYSGLDIVTSGSATGADRMSADNYRSLCRTQARTTAPNGTRDAYLRWSRTLRDGSPLLNSDGAAVGINKIQSSGSSATGIVTLYYADDDAGAQSIDVIAANANIRQNIMGVGDTITFSGAAATATTINIVWAVEFSPLYLNQAVTSAIVKAAIKAALIVRFNQYPIGGYKQTAGAGTISLEEIRSTVKSAHPAISDADLSAPVGATVIAVGHVPHLGTNDGTETPV